MTRRLRKLCLLGDYRTGKTRLVCRLTDCHEVPAAFGVQLHYWRAPAAPDVEFAIFDAAGRSSLDSLGQSFLSGADGFVAVADLALPETVDTALLLLRRAAELVGERPAVLLLNKRDRAGDELPRATALPAGLPVFRVSALHGDGVEAAFADVAGRVLALPAAAHSPSACCVQTC